MTDKKLIALCEYNKPIGRVINRVIPVGRPFCIDIGCPIDQSAINWWFWGTESHVYQALLRHKLPPEANAYSYSERSFFLEDPRTRCFDLEAKIEHQIIAVQLYRTE